MSGAKRGFEGLEKRLSSVRARFETFVSGRAPDDPLYLSNRSWKQKLKVGVIAAIPVLILFALVWGGATDVFRLHRIDPYDRPKTEAQPAAAVTHLPDPTLTPTDLEVVNIHIAREAHPAIVTGLLRNNTDRKVDSVEVSYYVADIDGSLLGTESVDVANVAAHGSASFRLPLKQANAEYVLVRDVHAN